MPNGNNATKPKWKSNGREPAAGGTIRVGRAPGMRVSYADVDASELQHLIAGVTNAGGCVIMSITRDGGAFALTCILGEDRLAAYPASSTEFLANATEILGTIDDG